jgi:hypothetical protein
MLGVGWYGYNTDQISHKSFSVIDESANVLNKGLFIFSFKQLCLNKKHLFTLTINDK